MEIPHNSTLRPASCFTLLIVPYLTYGICAWGDCALTFQGKIVTLQKRVLCLIYICKCKEHTLLKSNCREFSYLDYFSEIVAIYCMIWIDRQHQLVYLISSLLEQVRFITIEQDLSLATRFMLSSLELIKCMSYSRESVHKFGTLFLIRLTPYLPNECSGHL